MSGFAWSLEPGRPLRTCLLLLTLITLTHSGALSAMGGEGPGVLPEGSIRSGERVEREVYVMGTRSRLLGDFPDRAIGVRRLEGLLSSLEATERTLSTWRSDSLLSQLNRHPEGSFFALTPGLCSIFGALFQWTSQTRSAFDPAVGRLVEAWDLRGKGRFPSDAALADALRDSGLLGAYRFDPSGCVIMPLGNALIDAGAFAKGAGLDAAREWSKREGFSNWLVDLGGQVAAAGGPVGADSWTIPLAHPRQRHLSVMEVSMSHGSLATSGGSERDGRKDGRSIGHILDPRTGQGVDFKGSVAVWHESALTADILSTALFVMGPEEGLRWAETQNISTCFLIPDSENPDLPPRIVASTAFHSRFLE